MAHNHTKTGSSPVPATVVIVSCGTYDDYHVLGVFSSKEKAQIYMDAMIESQPNYYDKPFMETFDLDPAWEDNHA